MSVLIELLLDFVILFVGFGQVSIDTSWVDEVFASLLDAVTETVFGENGILSVVFNLLPVVGSNSLPVETWFIIVVFGGILIFLRYYRG